jgi:hypothetical protein
MKVIPHQESIDRSKLAAKIGKYSLYTSSLFVLFGLIAQVWLPNVLWLKEAITCCLAFSSVGYLVMSTAANIFFYRYTVEKRKDLLDNSFGTTYHPKKSQNYFSNDMLPHGIYKLGVNSFENAFFTTRVTTLMKQRMLLPVILVVSIFLISAVVGEQTAIQWLIKIPLAGNVIVNYSKIFFINSQAGKVVDEFISFFNCLDGRSELSDLEKASIIKLVLDYETSIAWGSYHNDEPLFLSINQKTTEDWTLQKEGLKIKH